MKIIISESQNERLRHIYRRIDKIEEYLQDLIGDSTWLISQDYHRVNFMSFWHNVANIVAHQVVEDTTKSMIDISLDDRVRLRNQIKKFIQDHYYQKIWNVWEKIYGVDKYTL